MKYLPWLQWILPAILIFLTLLIVIIKAYSVPITHDEVASAIYYPTFTVWQLIKFPDVWPSNHILNSILIKLSFLLFDVSTFTCRLPNVLSFVLYSVIIWSIARKYFLDRQSNNKTSLLYLAVFVCFLCNPYLLDFFGLARGYGMSNAFMVGSLFYCLRFGEERRIRFLWLTLVFASLAAYANFTLLIFFVSVNALLMLILFGSFLSKKYSLRYFSTHLALMLLFILAFAALCYTPIHKMQSTNQFVYWSANGFYRDTLSNLIGNSQYGVSYFALHTDVFAWVVIFIFFALFGVVHLKIYRKALLVFEDPLVLSFLILVFTIVVNLIQTTSLGTPNLTGRTALSYYPLFIAPFLFGIREVRLKWRRAGNVIAGILIALGLYHQISALQMKHVREWAYDQNTYDVIKYLDTYRKDHQLEKIQLNTSWLFNPAFTFYIQTGKSAWIDLVPYHKETDTTSNTPFYYIMNEDWNKLQKNYDPVLQFDGNARMLLKHK